MCVQNVKASSAAERVAYGALSEDNTLQAGPAYVEAFLSVLRNVTKEDVVQYVLALLDDLLTGQWA